jgi:hypothetical protein
MKARVLTFLLFLLHCGVNVANPIFVDSGITYKITSDSTVNVVPANKQESFYQIFKDSILLIPSSVEYGKRFYRVISIEEKAFSTWCGFRSLVISDGVEAIHNRAFAGCTNLRAVAIPKSVKNIGDNPFAYCFNLDSINVNEENALFDSRDGCNAIIRKKDNALLCACKSTEIPSSVETIVSYAFRGCLMREIKLPVGLKTIMEYAIYDCPNLDRIHIPSSVEEIYPRAFSMCDNIESISVDRNNPVYDSRNNCNAILENDRLIIGCYTSRIPSGITEIGEGAFAYCKRLNGITIPEGVLYIGSDAFWRCSGLKTIELPSSLLGFKGSEHFYCCTSLSRIHIPEKVNLIPTSIFAGCISLNNISVDNRNKKYDSRKNCNAVIETSKDKLVAGCSSSVIVNGIKEIGENAFAKSGITSLYIPASVIRIDSTSFRGSKYCNSIIVENDNPRYKSAGSNSIIEKSAKKIILACSTTNILPEVTSIGSYAYVNTVETLIIPSGIEYIGSNAFGDCTDLLNVFIPSSVKNIGRFAFMGCRRLSSVIFMNNNTKVEKDSFAETPYDKARTAFACH